VTEKDVEKWNDEHPVGTPVTVKFDNCTTHKGVVRDKAILLNGHTAVVWVTGIAGCYAVDRVTAR
jgi:hypothetical protein